jgi:hypothetical protein
MRERAGGETWQTAPMALPPHVLKAFDELPRARAEREARELKARQDRDAAANARDEARATERQQLRTELLVVWDWVESDAQELAAQMSAFGFNRLLLSGPLDEEGRPCAWQLGARSIILMFDGTLELGRQDDYRELRYAHRSAEEFLSAEPPGVTRAFIDAVKSGAVWETVERQLRESTATLVIEE